MQHSSKLKFKKAFYRYLLEAYIIFAIMSFFVVAIISDRLITNRMIYDKAGALYSEAVYIASSYAKQMYSGSLSIKDAGAQLKAIDTYLGCSIWIVDVSGRVILNTRDENAYENEMVINEFDPTEMVSSFMIGDFYGLQDSQVLSVYAPINSDFKIRGYVFIHSHLDDLMSRKEKTLNIVYITMVIIWLISLLVFGTFSAVIYLPLRKIIKATEEYAKGNYNYPLEIRNENELGYLGGTLGYMASEIARTEDNQKKFIANVSHDFRSPLTSIKGYLEAMIEGVIPPEMHEKYLGIVLNETERLTKLTSSLLQLNNLNISGVQLEIKDFDINQLIKRTCETFEGQCQKRRIAIDLVLTGERMLVSADEDKIGQVINNLLDNAIKFSNDNSIIKIETTEKGDKLFVSVKDSGIGIPKESIPLIFDRFYKSDHSRGKDKKGTGLGLSIIKEILKAHDENINVVSTEGVGTEFTFTVKRVI